MAGKKQGTAKGSASKAKSGAKSSAAKNTRSSGSKSNTKSRASSAKGKSTSSKQSAPSVEQLRQRNQTEAILWFGAAILTACFVLIPGGSVWLMVHNVLRGVFGGWAILLAVLMGYIAVSKTMEQTTMLRGGRLALMVVIVVLFCTAGHVFGSFFPKEKSFFKLVGILYMHGVEQGGAGLVGGLVGELLVKCAEVLGARIITGVLLFVSVLIFTGTIDREQEGWDGHVGFVPAYLKELGFDTNKTALLCGPPIMIKFCLASLIEMGFSKEQVYTTLELRMKCGIGKCGRCNIGSKYVCKDGPVFRCDEIDELPNEY